MHFVALSEEFSRDSCGAWNHIAYAADSTGGLRESRTDERPRQTTQAKSVSKASHLRPKLIAQLACSVLRRIERSWE